MDSTKQCGRRLRVLLFVASFFVVDGALAAGKDTTPALASKDLPKRLGPVVIRTGHGDDRVILGATTQLRINLESSHLERGARDVVGAFTLNRLRLNFSGRFIDDRLGFKLQFNFTPRQPELVDVDLSYRVEPRITLRAGQLKIPFTAYRSGSFASLPFVDWGETSRWFGAERQLGGLIEMPVEAKAPFAYAVGIFQGDNSRNAFANRWSELYGEAPVNRSSFSNSSPYGDPHPEFAGRLSFLPELQTIALGLHLSGAYDIRPELAHDATVRVAPELGLRITHIRGTTFALSAIYYAAWLTLSSYAEEPGITPLGSHGPQLEVSVLFARHYELAFRYGSVFNTASLIKDARARGDALLSDPAVLLDETSTQRYQKAGSSLSEHEISCAFNYSFIGESLKLQTDASLLPVQTENGVQLDSRLRAQLQLGF